jgi:hypothetical protein
MIDNREWKASGMMTENFLCSILIATGCFHDSEFGRALEEMFHTGEELEVIVRPIKTKHKKVKK